MKIIAIVCLFTALFIASCTQVNSNAEKNITEGDDTVSQVDISLSKLDAIEELAKTDDADTTTLVFKASGSEPGWIAEFYRNRIMIVADYGADKITVRRDNADLSANAETQIALKAGHADAIRISPKPCTNAAGEKESYEVTLSYKGKLYKGCGSFVK